MQKTEQRLESWRGSVTARLDRISMRRMAVYAGILFVFSLIPILVLGRYNVMCIDDYDFGRQVHDTWMATRSYVQSMQTAWQQSMEFYQNWQGTYVSCFLMGICPMNFNYGIAYVVPILMVSIFTVSVLVLGTHVLCRWLGADRAGSCFVMFMLLFMYYQVMEAPFEGIYWYNGAIHYVWMESVLFLCLTAISACIWTGSKVAEMLLCIASALLSVIVGGGNLVTGLQAEIMMALLILYAAVTNRKKLIAVVIPFITGSIGFLFNILAPGNAQRGALDMNTGYSAVMSVLLSFYHTVVFVIRWTPGFVILIWLLLLPVMWRIARQSERSFNHPVYVTLGTVCVIAAMFTPTLYAVGMVGLSRVDNIIQMVYYLCLMMVTVYWLGYFSHRATGGSAEPGAVIPTDTEELCAGNILGLFLEKAGQRMTAIFLLAVLAVWIFTADKNTYTSISALRSLVNGSAQTFYAEAMERHEVYTDDTVTDVEVHPYSARPELFDINDLTGDTGCWLNIAVAQYYHKESVRIVDE